MARNVVRWIALALLLGGCVDARSNAGAECARNSQCAAPLVCALERCRNECNQSRDCPIGSSCVRSESGFGVCLLEDETTCSSDGDCAGPLICRMSRCTSTCEGGCAPGTECREDACFDPAMDASCTRDGDCTEGACIAGRCRAQCRSDRDCRFGGFCVSGRCSTSPAADGGADAPGTDAAVDASVLCPLRTLDAVDVCTGFGHGCAVLENGTVTCWGRHSSGQLGNPFVTPPSTGVPSATPVIGVSDAVRIECGANHTCVLLTTGGLMCWGANVNGQLGTERPEPSDATPRPVVGLTDVTDFDLRQAGGCAVQDEQVWCWGSVDDGLGRLVDANRPTLAATLPAAREVEVIEGGGFVLATDGSLQGFGARGSELTLDLPFTNVGQLEASLGRVSGIDRMHVCVRRDDGEVWCAGDNGAGQLGSPDRGATSSTFASAVAGLESSAEIHLGSASTCSIGATGSAHCWGLNQRGDLGLGTTMNQLTPALVSEGVSAISISESFGCGVIDGVVSCWGTNNDSRMQGREGMSATPAPVECLP